MIPREWKAWVYATVLWLVLTFLFVRFVLTHDPMGTPPRPVP